MLTFKYVARSTASPAQTSRPSRPTTSPVNTLSCYTLPLLETANIAWSRVGAKGVLLVLLEAIISMLVPESAVPKSSGANLHVAVKMNENRFRLQLLGRLIFIV